MSKLLLLDYMSDSVIFISNKANLSDLKKTIQSRLYDNGEVDLKARGFAIEKAIILSDTLVAEGSQSLNKDTQLIKNSQAESP